MAHLICRKKDFLKYPRIIMLVDENVEKHCLPVFREHLPDVKIDHVISIKSGERGKNLEQSIHIWDELNTIAGGQGRTFFKSWRWCGN